MTSKWQPVELDDNGEIMNWDFVHAPDDSFWWVDSHNRLHTVMIKTAIWFKPKRIARVVHPDD